MMQQIDRFVNAFIKYLNEIKAAFTGYTGFSVSVLIKSGELDPEILAKMENLAWGLAAAFGSCLVKWGFDWARRKTGFDKEK